MVFRMTENPLKAPVRKYPVDYSYKYGSTVVINIALPEGMEIQDLIKNRTIMAMGPNLSYKRKVTVEGNQLQMIINFDVKDVEVKSIQYEQLRQFYTDVIGAEAQQIVSAKKPIN
jgi:hypothetical protein